MPIPASVKTIAALRKGPIARGALLSIAIRVTAIGLLFFQAVLMARLLGPGGYGVVAVALSVVSIAATVAMLGLGQLAVREVAQLSAREDWGILRGFLRFSTLTVLAFSSLAAIGIAVLAEATELFGPAFRTEILLGALLVPLLAMLNVLRGLCQGFGRIVAAQAPGDLLRPMILVAALGIVLLTATELTTTGYIAITIGATLAGTSAAALILRRIVAAGVPASRPAMTLGKWSLATRAFLGIALVGILLGEVNTLMLGWLVGPTEAGLFQPLARLAPVMLIGLEAVGMRYSPRVSELLALGEVERLVRITRLATMATTLIVVATCAGVLVLAPWILGAFGKAFTANVAALGWIAAAQVFNAACGPVGMLLAMSGHQSRVLVGRAVALATNVALGFWLIPQDGAHGAALAMAGGIVVWNLLMLLSVRRHLGFDPSLLGVLIRYTKRRGGGDSQR